MASTAIKPTDKQAILARYAEERAKRLRPDGNEQYLAVKGRLAHYAEDPYTEFAARDPLADHVTFTFVGGGFAGLVTGARMAEAGVSDIRILEKGGDFGGTWYWNRYPGAQCDTASLIYMPLLEETGHRPSEKYAHGPELYEHCQRIGRQYGLYDKALFHTEVTALDWDEAAACWVVETNRGDRFTSQFVGLGTGPLHVPKLPGIPGIESFKGHSFHTSRWDYAYTGGDPAGAPLDGLRDKRVAIIGTGATAVQAVPHLARAAQRLYVVQRTPSSVDVRANLPIDPEWFAGIATPGWQKRWLENFTAIQGGFSDEEDLVQDGWTDLARRIQSRIRELPPGQRNMESMLAAWEDADLEKMEEIRSRAETVVEDRETAEKLKAWYRQLCKRPCFHDAYLQAFNEPAAVLVDTDGKGVERITEAGFVVAGREYEVDCIIYASGFEVGTETARRNGFEVTGRAGLTLSEAWHDGMRSLHGMHVRGFPNLLLVQMTQGANLLSNYPHNLTEAASAAARIVAHARASGAATVEPAAEAQDKWVEFLLTGPARMLNDPNCTPGYYNNEGRPSALARYAVGYPLGALAFFRYLQGWLDEGSFKGLEFA